MDKSSCDKFYIKRYVLRCETYPLHVSLSDNASFEVSRRQSVELEGGETKAQGRRKEAGYGGQRERKSGQTGVPGRYTLVARACS